MERKRRKILQNRSNMHYNRLRSKSTPNLASSAFYYPSSSIARLSTPPTSTESVRGRSLSCPSESCPKNNAEVFKDDGIFKDDRMILKPDVDSKSDDDEPEFPPHNSTSKFSDLAKLSNTKYDDNQAETSPNPLQLPQRFTPFVFDAAESADRMISDFLEGSSSDDCLRLSRFLSPPLLYDIARCYYDVVAETGLFGKVEEFVTKRLDTCEFECMDELLKAMDLIGLNHVVAAGMKEAFMKLRDTERMHIDIVIKVGGLPVTNIIMQGIWRMEGLEDGAMVDKGEHHEKVQDDERQGKGKNTGSDDKKTALKADTTEDKGDAMDDKNWDRVLKDNATQVINLEAFGDYEGDIVVYHGTPIDISPARRSSQLTSMKDGPTKEFLAPTGYIIRDKGAYFTNSFKYAVGYASLKKCGMSWGNVKRLGDILCAVYKKHILKDDWGRLTKFIFTRDEIFYEWVALCSMGYAEYSQKKGDGMPKLPGTQETRKDVIISPVPRRSWPKDASEVRQGWRCAMIDTIWYVFCTRKGRETYAGGDWVIIEPGDVDI